MAQYDDLARWATQNPDSSRVLLGQNLPGPDGYQEVGKRLEATYFAIDDDVWNEMTKTMSRDEMWKINEAFLDQQYLAGKEFILAHDPSAATRFFLNEVEYLKPLLGQPVQDGLLWRFE